MQEILVASPPLHFDVYIIPAQHKTMDTTSLPPNFLTGRLRDEASKVYPQDRVSAGDNTMFDMTGEPPEASQI